MPIAIGFHVQFKENTVGVQDRLTFIPFKLAHFLQLALADLLPTVRGLIHIYSRIRNWYTGPPGFFDEDEEATEAT